MRLILVQKLLYERTLEQLAHRFCDLRVGEPLNDPDVGPLISEGQKERVLGFLDRANETGLHCTAEGWIDEQTPQTGFYLTPRLFRYVLEIMNWHRMKSLVPSSQSCLLNDMIDKKHLFDQYKMDGRDS